MAHEREDLDGLDLDEFQRGPEVERRIIVASRQSNLFVMNKLPRRRAAWF